MVTSFMGWGLTGGAAGYALFALWAAMRGRRREPPLAAAGGKAAGVTVLKPLCGAEPQLYANLRTFCEQDHPCHEVLFGVRDLGDPAIDVVRRLQADLPGRELKLVVNARVHGSNLKVSNLINLMTHARYDHLVLADSDMRVPRDYLTRVTAPLADPTVGVVTCLYGARAMAGVWSRLGGMFIDDWFAPSVHVACRLGAPRFSFGATIALRRATLEAIGGFEALKDSLADDFWLGELTRMAGRRTVLSDLVVTTDVDLRSARAFWRHELRWLRTIRSLAPVGFAFVFITFTFPMLALGLALAPIGWVAALALLGAAARLALHLWQSRESAGRRWRDLPWVPLRDLLLLAEWGAANAGWKVHWRAQQHTASPRLSSPALRLRTRTGLIVTADDFGLHPAVNEAVELAHTEGVLTSASLMVSGAAAADAIARARRLPRLRVGLHLVLADGVPLRPEAVPALVDASGRFSERMFGASVRFFLLPETRRQLEAEIRAQFEAYAATGLPLDHVNAHKHFHLHPTLLSLILRVGRDFGLTAVRLPCEVGAPFPLRPWLQMLRRRLDAAGIVHNDRVIGIRRSGEMNEEAMLAALGSLPKGVTEIYLHPATLSGSAIAPSMRAYRHRDELAALLSPRVRAAVAGLAMPCGGFSDLFG